MQAVIDLGDRCSDTLGFLARPVYVEMAEAGTVIAAVKDGKVAGYTCFDITRRYIRLVHLCVDPDYRGSGVARLLLDYVKDLYKDHPGVLARCRNSYGLAPVWSQLGFRQRREVKGRSHEGHLLTVWWYDFGHPDLFTRLDAEPLVEAAIDMNILRDLGSDATRSDAKESHALVADHVVDRLVLVSIPTLAQEIDTLEDVHKRQACYNAAQRLKVRGAPRGEVDRIFVELRDAVAADDPGYPKTESELFDLRHVAATVAAGVPVFVTRDTPLINRLSRIAASKYGVRILRPSDVIVHLDELIAADAFQPAALLGSGYTRQRLGAGHEPEVLTLVNKTAKERTNDFLKAWRDAATAGHDRIGIRRPDGQLAAMWIMIIEDCRLLVPILRVSPHRLADTLARQIIFRLRVHARQHGLQVVAITDPNPSPSVRGALADDDFREIDGAWHALCLDICADAKGVEATADTATQRAGLPPPPRIRSGMPAVAAATVERAWWPVKLADSQMPTYLVPIRQAFSTDLLGVPSGLFARQDELALSRENVYYRSPDPVLDAPARILWYMSSGGHSVQPAAVVGCSQLDDVVLGSPEDLHHRFRHLAVWDIALLRERARHGTIQALRFANTEIFARAIPRSRLKQLGRQFGEHSVPQGPTRISAELFAAVYQEGRPTTT